MISTPKHTTNATDVLLNCAKKIKLGKTGELNLINNQWFAYKKPKSKRSPHTEAAVGEKRLTSLLLITSSMGIDILLDRGRKINFGEISGFEIGLLHDLLDVRFLEDGASNWRAIATLVAAEILDVEDSFWIRGRNDGLLLCSGGAKDPVLYGARHGQSVLWIRTGAGDLPGLLDIPL